MTIRPRRGGYQVIVYAGIGPRHRPPTPDRTAGQGQGRGRTPGGQAAAEVADGRHRGTSARTVGELLDVYLAWPETRGKPLYPATLNDYRTIIETKLKPALGSCDSPSSTRSPWTASTVSCAAGAATTRPRSARAGSGRSTPCCPVPWAWPLATGGSASTRPGWPDPRPPKATSVRSRPRPRSARSWRLPKRRTRSSACSCGCAPPPGFGRARVRAALVRPGP